MWMYSSRRIVTSLIFILVTELSVLSTLSVGSALPNQRWTHNESQNDMSDHVTEYEGSSSRKTQQRQVQDSEKELTDHPRLDDQAAHQSNTRHGLSISEIWKQRYDIQHTVIDEAVEAIQMDDKNNITLDPDSGLTDFLMSEVVETNGSEFRTLDTMTEIISRKSKVYGDTHDRHLLTDDQKLMLKRGSKEGANSTKLRRNVGPNPLWSNGVVHYKIHFTLRKYKSIIYDAIKIIQDNTCIRMIQQQTRRTKDYIEFIESKFYNPFEGGCWSYVGAAYKYLNGKTQYVGLEKPKCTKVDVVVHEILHVLGLFHEQNRSDRDKHITLNWDNISGGRDNFNIAMTQTRNNNPYDVSSILQYGLYSFAKNTQIKTMVLKDDRLDYLVETGGLSYYDVQDIIDAYKCTSSCRKPLPDCKYGGYVGKNCKCICPPHLEGIHCETVINSQLDDCGGIVDISEVETKEIKSSSNYPGYKVGRVCTWLFVAAVNKKIRLQFNEFDLPTNSKRSACYHNLEAQFNLQGQRGLRYCGSVSNKPLIIDSNANREAHYMMISLDSRVSDVQAGRGFSVVASARDLFTTEYHCDFDRNKCFLKNANDDDFDWTRRKGATPSTNTGPSKASVGTYYMYIETSSPRKNGDRARLISNNIVGGDGSWCLTMDVHMYGSNVNGLSISIVSSDSEDEIKTYSGDKGQKWFHVALKIDNLSGKRIAVDATRGDGYRGDIAVDKIHLTNDICME